MALFIDSTEILPTYDIVIGDSIGGTHLKQIDVVEGNNPPVTVWRSSYTFTVTTTNDFYGGLDVKVNGTTVKTITTATTEEVEVLPGSSVVLSYQGSNWYSKTINADTSVSATNSYTRVSFSHSGISYRGAPVDLNVTTNRPITVSAYRELWGALGGYTISVSLSDINPNIAAGTYKYCTCTPSSDQYIISNTDNMQTEMVVIPDVVSVDYSNYLGPRDYPVNPTYTAGSVTVVEL